VIVRTQPYHAVSHDFAGGASRLEALAAAHVLPDLSLDGTDAPVSFGEVDEAKDHAWRAVARADAQNEIAAEACARERNRQGGRRPCRGGLLIASRWCSSEHKTVVKSTADHFDA
jgi:hypothetical protein